MLHGPYSANGGGAMAQSMALGINGIDTSVGTHICGFYHGREELESVLFPYLQTGVRDGEKTVCLSDSQRPEEVLESLRADMNVDSALSAPQLEVRHSSETYLPPRHVSVYDCSYE